MYNLSEQLLEQYTFEVTDIQKGRGAYICTTDSGKKIIKAYAASEIRAEAVCAFLQKAAECGVPADTVLLTKEGTVLAADTDGTTYYAREYIEGRECDTKNREDIMASMRALARFHISMKQNGGTLPEGMCIAPDMLLAEYERHNREVKKVRNYIRSKKRKNEFEMLFYQCYGSFLKKAESVTESLKRQLERTKGEELLKLQGICHGDFNQHNVIFSGGKVWISNFETAAYDVMMRDTANFVRKIMEKHNWSIGLAADMMRSYEKERPLLQAEWEQLYIRLSYPEKFWKIANHYYNSRKSWVSGRDIEKLQKTIGQEEQKERFLQLLFSFVK